MFPCEAWLKTEQAIELTIWCCRFTKNQLALLYFHDFKKIMSHACLQVSNLRWIIVERRLLNWIRVWTYRCKKVGTKVNQGKNQSGNFDGLKGGQVARNLRTPFHRRPLAQKNTDDCSNPLTRFVVGLLFCSFLAWVSYSFGHGIFNLPKRSCNNSFSFSSLLFIGSSEWSRLWSGSLIILKIYLYFYEFWRYDKKQTLNGNIKRNQYMINWAILPLTFLFEDAMRPPSLAKAKCMSVTERIKIACLIHWILEF